MNIISTTEWNGIFPAVMTQFHENLELDLDGTYQHICHLIDSGCKGIVMLGTLGENTSLSINEKSEVIKTAINAAKSRVPVICGIAEYTTNEAIERAEMAEKNGCSGLMVLPPMVYKCDQRETLVYFHTIAKSVQLPIMIYNNPIAYGVDITPEMFIDLSHEKKIVAIKESSEDPRRLVDIKNLVGNRFILFCGVDDVLIESLVLNAKGWVGGLVNAFPEEAVKMFQLATTGEWEKARKFYEWFMPLLHLDTKPKLVQYIKLCMSLTGLGNEYVRPPRLQVEGKERETIKMLVKKALETKHLLPNFKL